MKTNKLTFLITLPLLLNCSKTNDQRQLENEILELKSKIEKIENTNNSLSGNNQKLEKIDVNKNKIGEASTKKQNISETLLDDLENLSPYDIANKWVSTYNNLPIKYQNMVETENGSYPMDFGDWYGLNRGFSWGCEKNEKLYLVWEIIMENIATKSEKKAYKAGMVTQYVRNNIIKCQ